MHPIWQFILLLVAFSPVCGAEESLVADPDVPEELREERDHFPDDDDFNPGLGIFALIMVVGMLLLIGVGIALGVIAVIVLCLLTFFGMISSSVIFGFLKKNPASAFRMLFLQLGALIGLFCGIAGTLLASWIIDFDWKEYALYGCFAGIIGGLFLAWLFNSLCSRMHGVMTIRYEGRRGDVKVIESRTERF